MQRIRIFPSQLLFICYKSFSQKVEFFQSLKETEKKKILLLSESSIKLLANTILSLHSNNFFKYQD